MAELSTTDDRVMMLALPWVQVFDRDTTNLVIDALWQGQRAETSDHERTVYTAGQQAQLHEVRNILRLIQVTRTYHEDSIRHHPGQVFVVRREWVDAGGGGVGCPVCGAPNGEHQVWCRARGKVENDAT